MISRNRTSSPVVADEHEDPLGISDESNEWVIYYIAIYRYLNYWFVHAPFITISAQNLRMSFGKLFTSVFGLFTSPFHCPCTFLRVHKSSIMKRVLDTFLIVWIWFLVPLSSGMLSIMKFRLVVETCMIISPRFVLLGTWNELYDLFFSINWLCHTLW